MAEPTMSEPPFSNGHEWDMWEWRNCGRCRKASYENTAGGFIYPCELEAALWECRWTEAIPTEFLARLGIDRERGDASTWRCTEFEAADG